MGFSVPKTVGLWKIVPRSSFYLHKAQVLYTYEAFRRAQQSKFGLSNYITSLGICRYLLTKMDCFFDSLPLSSMAPTLFFDMSTIFVLKSHTLQVWEA